MGLLMELGQLVYGWRILYAPLTPGDRPMQYRYEERLLEWDDLEPSFME